jgi:hypothetical protein
MDVPVQLPIVVTVDNMGAIYMSKSHSTTGKMKHLDIRHNFIRQCVDEGFLKIIFVKSEDNLSDGYTKNTSIEVYKKNTMQNLLPLKTTLNMTIITVMIRRVSEGS